MTTRRRRGGAPFRQIDPNETIESAIMKFLGTSPKSLISNGRYGVVLKCGDPSHPSTFVETLDPRRNVSTVIVKVSIVSSNDFVESADLEFKKNNPITLETVNEDEFRNEVAMQRKGYHDSIEILSYPICPMVLFAATYELTDPMMSWIKVTPTYDKPKWKFSIIVMEMLSEGLVETLKKHSLRRTDATFIRPEELRKIKELKRERNDPSYWANQMAFALCIDLLKLGIIHGDLHTNNVLIANNRVYIIDFGYATMMNEEDQQKYKTLVNDNLEMYLEFYENDPPFSDSQDLTKYGNIDNARPELLTEDERFLLLRYCPQEDGNVQGLTPEEQLRFFQNKNKNKNKEHVPLTEAPPETNKKRRQDESFLQTSEAVAAYEEAPPMDVVRQEVDEAKSHVMGRFGMFFARVWDRVRVQAKRFKPSGGSRRRRTRVNR